MTLNHLNPKLRRFNAVCPCAASVDQLQYIKQDSPRRPLCFFGGPLQVKPHNHGSRKLPETLNRTTEPDKNLLCRSFDNVWSMVWSLLGGYVHCCLLKLCAMTGVLIKVSFCDSHDGEGGDLAEAADGDDDDGDGDGDAAAVHRLIVLWMLSILMT